MKRSPKTLWRGETLAPHIGRASISLGLAAALGTLAFTALSLRRPSTSQKLPVTIGWQSADSVLTLTASTPLKSASFVDRWSVTPSLALASATVLDESSPGQARCVSRACASESALAPDTTYTFSYSIVMKAGADTWSGSGSVAITIGLDDTMPQPRGAGTSS
jgi:hypothetical protein